MTASRRSFLASLAASTATVAGGSAVGRMVSAREVLVSSLLPPDAPDLWERLRGHSMLQEDIVYLNHASIGTIPQPVHQARVEYLSACEANPWRHLWAGLWEGAREEVRGLAADQLGCPLDWVAITHNTTELFNILALGLPLEPDDEVLWSSLAHVGSTEPFRHAARRGSCRTRSFAFPLERVPRLSAEEVVDVYVREIRPETRLLIVPHVDNMVGLRHPMPELAEAARERGVEWIAVDAAQSVGMLPVNVGGWNVDAVGTSPHKWLQAPKGLGLACVHERLRDELEPMWVTWGQRQWSESARKFEDYGTRNLPEVLALGDAMEYQGQVPEERREARLRAIWERARERCRESGLQWKSPESWDLAASLYAIEVPGRPSNDVFQQIWNEHGVVVRAFPSATLNSLRVSPNVTTSDEDLERFFHAVSSA